MEYNVPRSALTLLSRLSDALTRVPEFAPRSFYEAVLSIAVAFSYDPDSLGTLDRYLAPFYDDNPLCR